MQCSPFQIAIVKRNRDSQSRFRGMFQNIMTTGYVMNDKPVTFKGPDNLFGAHDWETSFHSSNLACV